jgi:DsbC/DsbD-like thiol-disulfide interchange protein
MRADLGSMTLSMRCVFIAFSTAVAYFGLLAAGSAQEASAWATGLHSRAQLVSGGPLAEGDARLAGVIIKLDPGFKTYWRHPGESGLPPAFDWSRSSNVANIEVLWPAPTRFEDAGGVSYGYAGGIVLPVRVKPQDARQPVRLVLKLDYGVCKDICIPAQADLLLTLPKAGGSKQAPVMEALARVPKQQPLGAPGELSILRLKPTAVEGKTMIEVVVRAPDGQKPQLFAEGPENWFLAAAGEMKPAPASDGAAGSFLVEIAERPKDAAGTVELRLTLVAGSRAVETPASLDTARLPR